MDFLLEFLRREFPLNFLFKLLKVFSHGNVCVVKESIIKCIIFKISADIKLTTNIYLLSNKLSNPTQNAPQLSLIFFVCIHYFLFDKKFYFYLLFLNSLLYMPLMINTINTVYLYYSLMSDYSDHS